jgi:DNA-binding phage protein
MVTTTRFSRTVKADLQRNSAFRRALLSEAVACMVSGDIETGKVTLREYVNGTVGFLKLAEALGRSPKSLMRMLSPTGNPQARNLFEMVAYLQKAEGTVLEVHARKPAA